MSGQFEPFPGLLSLRLLGFQSKRVLTARDGDDSVNHVPESSKTDNEFWYMVAHSENDKPPGALPIRPGYYGPRYAFRNKRTGRFLSLQGDPTSRVSQIDVSGVGSPEVWPFLWFGMAYLFARGNNFFHIFSVLLPLNRIVLRPGISPEVHFADPNQGDNENQVFNLLWEDTRISRIQYHLDDGRILQSTPVHMGNRTSRNVTDVIQTGSHTITYEESTSTTFTHSHGFSIGVETTISAGVPLIVEGKITFKGETQNEWSWGTENIKTTSVSVTFELNAPPHSTTTMVGWVTRSQLDVPFTVYSRSVATGHEVATAGVYRGVDFWDIRTEYEQFPLRNAPEIDGGPIRTASSLYWRIDPKATKNPLSLNAKSEENPLPLDAETKGDLALNLTQDEKAV